MDPVPALGEHTDALLTSLGRERWRHREVESCWGDLTAARKRGNSEWIYLYHPAMSPFGAR